MTRIALGIQYDGAAFSGWQSQPHGNTVQDVLEAALREFAGVALPTTVAGRTDAGVHALGQVIHLDTDLVRDPFSWVRGTNAFLPPTVAVRWAQAMPEDFHARFSAHRRTYYYALTYGPTRAPLLEGKAGYVTLPPGQVLDVAAMHEAAQVLVGEHDFSSFRAAECQAKSPIKTMYSTEVRGQGEWVFVRIRGSAFLHHMVRNIMGCLVAIGRGKRPAAWMGEVLAARERKAAAPTFMPDGLYLAEVGYPDAFRLPVSPASSSLFRGMFDEHAGP
ncbi:tRNA pseudouridine(38-40) synthase TruA [Ralstonia solanacearum species complex bacterium KE056]|uniref:tRNA pseudouridine(38-40) synthase TruA n=1 Tax=Ralstonia solanacearum species complex bacterium KE056 TaxID=3119585 RepID=UPI002FC39634